MIAKLLLQNLIWIAAMGALLFVPAGTLHWPAAGNLPGTIAILGISCGLWLARTDPALLAERMHPMMQRISRLRTRNSCWRRHCRPDLVLSDRARSAVSRIRRPTGLQALDGRCCYCHRLHHVGDAREFVRNPVVKLQTSAATAWSRPALRLGAASHVQRHRLVFRGRADAVGSWWGGDVAAVHRAVCHPRRDRGTRVRRPPVMRLHARVRYRLVPGLCEAYMPTTASSRAEAEMPEPKTYTGGCHCGMVRFECTAILPW